MSSYPPRCRNWRMLSFRGNPRLDSWLVVGRRVNARRLPATRSTAGISTRDVGIVVGARTAEPHTARRAHRPGESSGASFVRSRTQL